MYLLSINGLQLLELLGQRRPGRENWRAGRGPVHDVHDVLRSARLGGSAILVEEGLDHGAAGGDIVDCELAIGISG